MVDAVGSSYSNGYNDPIETDVFNFKANLNDRGKVDINWNAYKVDGFNYYKVIRSATNPNPVYPDDGYIKAISDYNTTGYTDNSPLKGKSYYRVCAIVKPNRYCSKVVVINNGEVVDCTDTVADSCAVEIEEKKSTNGYKEMVYTQEFDFKAELYDGKVITDWKIRYYDDFAYYKVMRSIENPDPVYPDDSYIQAINDYNMTGYTDANPPKGTLYYRVCAITSGKDRFCSNVVKIVTGYDLDIPTYGSDGEPYPDRSDWQKRCDAWNGEIELDGNCHWSGGLWCDASALYDGDCLDIFEKYGDPRTKTTTTEKKDDEAVIINPSAADEASHQYNGAITYLKNAGVVQGYEDGSFKPDNNINRAEFTKIIVSTIYFGALSGNDCFEDVADEWFAPYVCFAKNNGLIEGYADGTFKPYENINFAEAAKIVMNAFGIEYSEEEWQDWYAKYVSILAEKKFIPQSITSAEHLLTRGEMAEIVWRIKENIINQLSGSVEYK